MLDDYKLEQRIIYKIISNSIVKDKCSHAYLIETNGYHKSFEFVMSFAKTLLCPFNYKNLDNCGECCQCSTIDDENFLELKIIRPDGEWIKKEQLDELQSLFNKKAVIGSRKIYIIDGVEKLNVTSANSILKFLEEPEEGIIALLITENINKVLTTIVSRCQILSLKNVGNYNDGSLNYRVASRIFNSEKLINDFVNNEEMNKFIDNIFNFVKYYENNGMDTLLEIESLWNSYINNRNTLSLGLDVMLLIYKDILNYLMNNPIEVFNDYRSDMERLAIKLNVLNISKKINIIIDLKDKIKYNINVNLLMDKLLIKFEGCDSNE